MMLKVLGRATSINVRKVLWTCTELGLTYEHEDWGGPALPLQTPEFRALNPNAQVPVLIHDELVLWESNTICRYLAAEFGGSELLPSAPRARAVVEQWMDWASIDLNFAWLYVFMARVRKNPDFANEADAEASALRWNRRMTILDARLEETQSYVAGPTFSLADIVLALATHRWRSTLSERPKLPNVERWFESLSTRAGFKQFCRADVP